MSCARISDPGEAAWAYRSRWTPESAPTSKRMTRGTVWRARRRYGESWKRLEQDGQRAACSR